MPTITPKALAALIDDGKSVAEISASTGIHRADLYAILRACGIDLRAIKRQQKLEAISVALAAGKTQAQASRDLGYRSRTAVSHILSRAGI